MKRKQQPLTPHVICFYDDRELGEANEYDLDELREELEDSYDFNRDDYEFVQEGTEAETDGYYEAIPYQFRIVKRISDGRYFKWRDHCESWSLEYPSVGEYGDIFEVVPTEVVVFKPV